jgi:hypothetical protein
MMELGVRVLKAARVHFAGWIVAILFAAIVLPTANGQAQHSPHPSAKRKLAAAAETASRQGIHATLPPHISILLGITKEENWPVMQGVVRTGNMVQGIDVGVANQNDIVLFVVDEAASNQSLYLTSREGLLRKVVSVKAGVGGVVRITDEQRKAFEKEKQFWIDRLVPPAAAK